MERGAGPEIRTGRARWPPSPARNTHPFAERTQSQLQLGSAAPRHTLLRSRSARHGRRHHEAPKRLLVRRARQECQIRASTTAAGRPAFRALRRDAAPASRARAVWLPIQAIGRLPDVGRSAAVAGRPELHDRRHGHFRLVQPDLDAGNATSRSCVWRRQRWRRCAGGRRIDPDSCPALRFPRRSHRPSAVRRK